MKDFKESVHLQGMLLKPGTGNGERRTANGERQTENWERSGTESTTVLRITIQKKKKVFKRGCQRP